MSRVAVLFARSDSNYFEIDGCDVYDKGRDARSYSGVLPVVAHPPCRAFGRLRQFARPEVGEIELAYFAVDQVRRCGGVLEHPCGSKLWEWYGLPKPGESKDKHGGYSICVEQFWWGHLAAKRTWLYIVGVDRSKLEPAPLVFDEPTHCVSQSRRQKRGGRPKPYLRKADREHSPPMFARYLVDIAARSIK